ncbi:UNVERIFIED_CONTAM: hypothetical protein FKN15_074582 [Acipenser sinensis]
MGGYTHMKIKELYDFAVSIEEGEIKGAAAAAKADGSPVRKNNGEGMRRKTKAKRVLDPGNEEEKQQEDDEEEGGEGEETELASSNLNTYQTKILPGLLSSPSSKGTPHGGQYASYSLEITGSNPGYVVADRDREFPGGDAQLAERYLGREGLSQQGNPRFTTHQRLWVCCGAIQICIVLRHYRSDGFTVDL